MTDDRRRAFEAARLLQAQTTGSAPRVAAAQVDGYRVTDIPSDAEFTDADWDGSDAEASYPNPTADDTDIDFLADHYLFPPSDMGGDDPPPKSAFKGPIRLGVGGPISTGALLANVQAINGARGGFEDVSMDTLREGFDTAVQGLVDAGFYDSADDAPDFEGEAARVTAEYGFDTGDTVTWAEGTVNQAYGVIRDRAQDGSGNFGDRIDGDFALDATEENPAYLIEIAQERDDGWVTTGTMVGHRQDTLSAWDPDGGVSDSMDAWEATEATATLTLTASDGDGDGGATLTGVIWGAGDHDLALGGDATPVRVPQETIEPTFRALQDDIDAGDVTLGFDHPDPDSVAAQTGIVDIGVADSAALTADDRQIVLTDSTLTADRAADAARNGQFDDLDWSVVADVAVRRDADGSVQKDDGRVVLDAVRIRRIDAVETGAVDAASIERDRAALPDLREQTRRVRNAAQGATPTTTAADALRASAQTIQTMDTISTDPDDLEGAQRQLEAAGDIIDRQRDELETAQAAVDAFEDVLSAHGVDRDDFDSATAAAQAVIDEQTEATRREIAELEADLPQYDTSDVDSRVSDLAGSAPQDLQNTLNARKATAYDAEQTRQSKARATAKDDKRGRVSATDRSGGGQTDADADDVALGAMDGGDRIEAEAAGIAPADYVREQYGLDASQYDAADELHADIIQSMNAGDN